MIRAHLLTLNLFALIREMKNTSHWCKPLQTLTCIPINCGSWKLRNGNLMANRAQASIFKRLESVIGEESFYLASQLQISFD